MPLAQDLVVPCAYWFLCLLTCSVTCLHADTLWRFATSLRPERSAIYTSSPRFCEELAANVVGMSYLHENPSAVNNYYWVVACNSGGCSDIDSKNPVKPIETRPHAPAATPSSTGGAGELAQERAAELLAGELGVAVAG